MAITTGQVVVGATGATAAAQVVVAANTTYTQTIAGQAQATRDVVLVNGSGAVYLAGTTGVTGPSNGFPLAASGTLTLRLHSNEAICVVASGTTGSTVSFLATGS